MSDERRLIARAARGDPRAFEVLATRHRPAALRIARGVLGDPDAAEDVAQDVLVRLATAISGFRGDSELATWVYRVTLNLCRDVLRRRRRARDQPLDTAESLPQLADRGDVGEAIDLARARQAVRDALARLPDEQREALALRYLTGLPYAEIAQVTDTAQGTIASRVFRALERLGRELEPRHLEALR